MLVLYASELAALIGRHKYQPAHEAALRLWHRTSPDTLQEAKRRCDLHIETEQERETRALTSIDEVPAHTEADMGAYFREQLRKPLFSLQDDEELHEQVAALQSLAQSERETALRCVCKFDNMELAPPVQALVNAQIERVSHQSSSTVADCKSIVSIPKLKDCPRTKAALRSGVNKMRGISLEKCALQAYTDLMAGEEVNCPTVFYRTQLVDNITLVGGRVDALRGDDTVVEIKCRQNRFFDTCPDYEYVQVLTYMKLTQRSQCDLVQYFKGQLRVQTFEYDEEAWEYIAAAAVEFSQEFRQLLANQAMQDGTLATVAGCSC